MLEFQTEQMCYCYTGVIVQHESFRSPRRAYIDPLSPVHTGDKVDRIGNKVERIRQQSTSLPICCRFLQQSTFNKVDRVEFNFVASVYRALMDTLKPQNNGTR